MIKWILAIGLLVVFVAACGGDDDGSTTPTIARETSDASVETTPFVALETNATPSQADLLDAYEALYRHQFQHNASGLQQAAGVYFLELDGEDPPASLLSRFEDNAPPVRGFSRVDGDSVSGVFDSITGERGLIFRIYEVSPLDANTIETKGGYYEAGLSSSYNIYRLEREDGTWVVAEDRLIAIS